MTSVFNTCFLFQTVMQAYVSFDMVVVRFQ